MRISKPLLYVHYANGKVHNLTLRYEVVNNGKGHMEQKSIGELSKRKDIDEQIYGFLNEVFDITRFVPIQLKISNEHLNLNSIKWDVNSITYYLNKLDRIVDNGLIISKPQQDAPEDRIVVEETSNNQALTERLLKDGYTIKLENNKIIVVE